MCGIGTEEDEKEAFEWFLKCAERGIINDAKYEVADCYMWGMGTEKDEQKAFEWLLNSS
jgi:TPR repeat protein